MKSINEISISCPCCNQEKKVQNTILPDYFNYIGGDPNSKSYYHDFKSWLDFIVRATPTSVKRYNYLRKYLWACNDCFKDGKAIKAEYYKQNHGMSGPIICYIDIPLTCEKCKKNFVFTSKEQQYWYETLQFFTDSFPKNCSDCRKEIRDNKDKNKRLGELLNKDNKEIDDLKEIERIYREFGLMEKARIIDKQIQVAKRKQND